MSFCWSSWADLVEQEEKKLLSEGEELLLSPKEISLRQSKRSVYMTKRKNVNKRKNHSRNRKVPRKKKRCKKQIRLSAAAQARFRAAAAKQRKELKLQLKLQLDKEERGRKIFIGGVIFDDIENIGVSFVEDLKKLRTELLEEIFHSLGDVCRIAPKWSKRYCHVVYKTRAQAKRVFATLSSTEKRKQILAQINQDLLDNGIPEIATPPNFYVRWPRTYNMRKKQSKKQKKAKQFRRRRNNPGQTRKVLYWFQTSGGNTRPDWSIFNVPTPVTIQADENLWPSTKKQAHHDFLMLLPALLTPAPARRPLRIIPN
eukprot:TRINITY_DN3064_c0_g1_i1.p2 TRINITY_DN3064_c0_g1~~TRINITY_DN3064_c0_g1_i1.p2  ORF type:complete len:314 (-),score=64.65 TRINITY_DN3064_c0_g1_i1:1041-1982(-)